MRSGSLRCVSADRRRGTRCECSGIETDRRATRPCRLCTGRPDSNLGRRKRQSARPGRERRRNLSASNHPEPPTVAPRQRESLDRRTPRQSVATARPIPLGSTDDPGAGLPRHPVDDAGAARAPAGSLLRRIPRHARTYEVGVDSGDQPNRLVRDDRRAWTPPARTRREVQHPEPRLRLPRQRRIARHQHGKGGSSLLGRERHNAPRQAAKPQQLRLDPSLLPVGRSRSTTVAGSPRGQSASSQ